MSELSTTQSIRASAAISASETVELSNDQLFRFAKEAMFIFTISSASSLNINIAFQSSLDGTTFYDTVDMGDYTANGTHIYRIEGSSLFGQYQQLYITRTSGSCTLKIDCEMVEVL